jgi:uncharacterized membrane protein YhaH (DUF805 family)
VQSTKILVTVAVWLAALTIFVLRLRGILLTKRFSWACLILFVAAMLSLLAVERSRHATVAAEAITQWSGPTLSAA